MKHCTNCHRVNPDNVKECIECEGKEFQHIIIDKLPPPFYNNTEEYKEANNA